MTRFADPWAFALLAPIAFGLWARLYRPRWFTAALSFSTGSHARRLAIPASARLLRKADGVLPFVAAALACAALARPQAATVVGLEPEQGVDIVIVLDTSPSMKALDFDPMDRITAAKRHAEAFIRGRRSDRIGIVGFGGHAFLQCPLTLDYPALLQLLNLMEPGMTDDEGTAVGDAIATAVTHLSESVSKSKVVILMTDGRSNAGAVDAITAAKAAAALGIKVYTIGTATRGPSMYPMEDPVYGTRWVQMDEDLDEETLKEVAARTGAKYFRAANTPDMEDVFKEIDRLEKSKVEAPPILSTKELYPFFLIPAMLVALMHLVTTRIVMVKVP